MLGLANILPLKEDKIQDWIGLFQKQLQFVEKKGDLHIEDHPVKRSWVEKLKMETDGFDLP